MIENLITMGEALVKLVSEVVTYGAGSATGVAGLYLLYRAGMWIKNL